ncbi:MAG: EF-P lysine aminoacylase EpmA [Marinicellaceae bacterium]
MNKNCSTQCPLSVLKQRAFLLSKIRAFFEERNVLEVETPVLSSAGNTDINIESFTAEKINPNFSKSYLRTSPEFPLKRLLCSGIGDVFELAKVFRKGEHSSTHNCEFSLLEWYRIDFNYLDLINEVKQLMSFLSTQFKWQVPEADKITYGQCFQIYLNIDLNNITDQQLNSISHSYGYSGSFLSFDEALDFLFATQIQPQLDADKLTFVTHYPSSQAALAQIDCEDNKTALRFEVFYKGHELGNGYQELTNADELLNRFENDNSQRKLNAQQPIRIDDELIAAMRSGMPNCSGIAMGIDRILMVFLDKQSIQEVMPFNALNS